IKALVSEKFFWLCDEFGAANVGMLTGDASINRDAPIICCTAEILSNMALHQWQATPVDAVVIDEFHYYSDPERGSAWQIPLLTLPHCTFLLMSATLGDCIEIQKSVTERTGREVAMVRSLDRPVPLDFEYRETFIHETIERLVEQKRYPIYIVHFTQREAAESAQDLMSANYCSKEEKQAINEAVRGFRFDTPYGKEVARFVRHGVGVHHAGLLPKYRLLVEQLAQEGRLKVICGTDTLGVGVNIPIRSVLFSKLCKFDGEKVGILSIREFKQIAGRAGRKGFDERGSVLVQAPEHVIENKKLEQKIQSGDKKRQKVVKKKPPERNFVAWDENTFKKLVEKPPEPMQSRFEVSHGMLLHLIQGAIERAGSTPDSASGVLSPALPASQAQRGPQPAPPLRPSSDGARSHRANGYRLFVELVRRSHETAAAKRRHLRRARVLFKSLREAGIVSVVRNPRTGNRLLLNTDLQRDFSLNHTLSLYLIDTLPRLDRNLETYPLDVLSLCESILENPEVILRRQVDKLFEARLAELKAQGMEYDERMEILKQLEHPKPNREFSYDTFNAFAAKHPWVGGDDVRPKSVAREIFERYCSFNEYVSDYGIQRSEGALLRYLSDCYKTLVQNVPEQFKDEGVYEILAFLRALLQGVDSSLIKEWELLLEPAAAPLPEAEREQRRQRRQPFDPEVNPRAFATRVRAELHRLVQALSRRAYEEAVACVRPLDGDAWTAERFEQALAPFFAEHQQLLFNHQARLPTQTIVDQTGPRQWRVRQVLLDPAEHNDWFIDGEIDLSTEVAADQPLVAIAHVGC
ncbi:MAG: DUF3516 domain-containing protein, partial [Deltaproteobacteria bacterium]|nr:DUF3516 domain-containing protein [Deltaproteobacteria bacterium]